MKFIKVAQEWLGACSGCEIAMLNMGEKFFDLLKKIEMVHMPLLFDHKTFDEFQDAEIEISVVSGCVISEGHLHLLKKIREKSQKLCALGTCATHGGIPSLLNSWSTDVALKEIFSSNSKKDHLTFPNKDLSGFLDRVYALDEFVEVDILLPGCPPRPSLIREFLSKLIKGDFPSLPNKSVCDTCPTLRFGKGRKGIIKRPMENPEYDPNEPIEKMRCFLEQGYLCMGPVTLAGCAFDDGPPCIKARTPCRGCYGPVYPVGNQMLEMMNALASVGIEWKTIIDRRSLLRFSGAHGLLGPYPGSKQNKK